MSTRVVPVNVKCKPNGGLVFLRWGTPGQVLWEDSGWKAAGMQDLVEAQRVKRAYMRANLIVHPDKVKQKGGSVDQVVISDMVFDALKTAWAQFEARELRGGGANPAGGPIVM